MLSWGARRQVEAPIRVAARQPVCWPPRPARGPRTAAHGRPCALRGPLRSRPAQLPNSGVLQRGAQPTILLASFFPGRFPVRAAPPHEILPATWISGRPGALRSPVSGPAGSRLQAFHEEHLLLFRRLRDHPRASLSSGGGPGGLATQPSPTGGPCSGMGSRQFSSAGTGSDRGAVIPGRSLETGSIAGQVESTKSVGRR